MAIHQLAKRDAPAGAGLSVPLILVVEPDPAICALYVTALARVGWRVDGVDDGRLALAKALSDRPAVIVTEVEVPYLDGIALCGLLRRDPDTRDIRLVVVTGEHEQRHVELVKKAGADRVIRKPCPPDSLAEAIQAVVATTPLRAAARAPVGDEDAAPPHRSRVLSKAHRRCETTNPPLVPPALVCPRCDRPLTYLRSHLGGVNNRQDEQWDDYECPTACGQFQYRHRTRRIRYQT